MQSLSVVKPACPVSCAPSGCVTRQRHKPLSPALSFRSLRFSWAATEPGCPPDFGSASVLSMRSYTPFPIPEITSASFSVRTRALLGIVLHDGSEFGHQALDQRPGERECCCRGLCILVLCVCL